MLQKYFSALLGVCLIGFVMAADPFAVMDFQAEGLAKTRPQMSAETLQCAPRNSADEARGFRASAVDFNYNWRKDLIWNAPELKSEIELVTAPGDYTCGGFSIFFSKPASDFKIAPDALTNQEGGGSIPAERIRVLEVAAWQSVPRFLYTNMLWEPQLQDLKAGDLLNCVVMVDVPKGTPGGLYKGALRLHTADQELSLAIVLRVADFELPEAGVFGFYMNGNLYRSLDGYNCNQKSVVPENLKRYFDFYKTRRFNSISIYDNLPDLRYVDGHVTGSFADASALAKAMNESGLANAMLFFDLRDVGYWCNAVALKLDSLGGKAPAGDLGVTMAQRKPSTSPYPEKAKELYAEAIRLLLAQAKAEKWPELRIFADEELGNQFPLKVNNYECYMPVIMKTAPEYAVVIDNGIGWGRTTCTEYAARDHVKFRQYNSWTEEALAQAKKEDATVMTFNYDTSRLSNGFTQVRIGSRGHHQWADLWDAANYQWQFSHLSEKGVVTSLGMERMHEGVVDYAACAYLEKLAAEQAAKGNVKLADEARKVLSEVSMDLSVNHTTAQNYGFLFTNADLNARRWKVFQAIDKLLGKSERADFVPGTPEMRVQAAKRAALPQNDFILKVKNQQGEILAEANAPEDFWSDFIGPLTHLTEYEAQLRAFASNEDEFKRHNSPSYSVVRVASLPEGLAISTIANHVMPKPPYRFERKDDDGDMWQDDCWEFFFGLPNGKLCHLMFNSAGAKTFLNTGVVVPGKEIKSYIKSPVNESGGTSNKLLIPWHCFGLKQQPLPGTVWEFNVGREMHTHRTPAEALMSWARLATSFHEQDKWGRLVFTDAGAVGTVKAVPALSVEPNIAKLFVSGQPIRFNVEARSGNETSLALAGTLRQSPGKQIPLKAIALPIGASELTLDTHGLQPGPWTLELYLKGWPKQVSNTMHFTVLSTPWK